MKLKIKYIFILIFLSINIELLCTTEKWVIDKIIATVNGTRILNSDLNKPRIAKDGQTYSLDELIGEELLVQKSIERHFIPSESDVERQIVAFKIQNGLGDLTQSEFEDELKKFGFTLKEYKNQLARLLASENLKRMEITDNIIVTTQEVEDYYNKHVEYTPEVYNLKMIPINTDSKNKTTLNRSESIDLNYIKREDLDPKFEFVLKMKKGEISKKVEVNNKDYVIEILDKKESRKKTLNERYKEIEKLLILKRQKKLIKNFETELKKNSTVIIF